MQNVIVNKGNQISTICGADAIDVYRIKMLKIALKMLIETKGRLQPTRGFTLTYGLSQATLYTGNKYKRTEGQKAMEELQKIMDLRLQHIAIVEAEESI